MILGRGSPQCVPAKMAGGATELRWGRALSERGCAVTEQLYAFLASSSAELRCEPTELTSRLAGPPDFIGHSLLPAEIIEAWSDLPITAKAVAVLFAAALDEENERRWDRHDRL